MRLAAFPILSEVDMFLRHITANENDVGTGFIF